MPQVTVVISAYNSMEFLPATLDSVLQQTFTDFEVLIVNDGSTDHIIPWASEIIDPRVKLISQENKGVSEARNTGINHAQGEYIAFLDADDLWKLTKLEKQIQCFASNPEVGLVYTWTLLVNQQGKSIGAVVAAQVEGHAWEKLLLGDVVGNGSSAMIRRSCFNHVGLFDPELPFMADCDMWSRIASHYPLGVVKEILVYYRQHPNGMSRDYDKLAQNSRLKIEKSFAQAPFELLYLRPRAYGHAFLWLALKVIYESGDSDQCSYYAQQAALHYPQLRYSARFLQLQVTLILIRRFGIDIYMKLKKMNDQLRGDSLQYHQ